ncbi:MAG: helix-turn-helix domain-containing protein [Ruminococcaceae bacterium]|nr:helix-turn-helix domain-containing protein [Oscillospiraceae bacterium]
MENRRTFLIYGGAMVRYFALFGAGYDQRAGREVPLYLNNFGYQRALPQDATVSRPRGREDFHLLYVASGEIEVGGRILRGGDSYVYFPGEAQKYTYCADGDSLYYWMHFTGRNMEKDLAEIGLCSGFHPSNGKKQETDALFRLIYDLLTHGSDRESPYIVSLTRALFELIASPKSAAQPFSGARRSLESEDISVGDIAARYGMTAAHFIRSFRAVYGVTPQRYRSDYRLREAKMMLSDTALSVSSVAERCGFDDPLYFSRAFKKHFGMTPTEYRKNNLET